MTPLEREIETALRSTVEQHGGLCLKWVCPGWSGVPDRIVLLPGGRIHFIELKRPKGGRLSALQRWWGGKLLDLGFSYQVVHSRADLELFKVTCLDW